MKKAKMLIILIFIYCMLANMITLSAKNIEWTEEESLFIQENSIIKLGVDPHFIPFEFIDSSGNYKGIAADYIELISERTGLSFIVLEGLSWPEAYELALNKEVDALSAIGKTAEREENFLFTKPYYFFKRVITTSNSNSTIKSIKDLEGKTVAVQRNSSHHSYLLDYSNITLSLYDSVESALVAFSVGEEIAFIGNLATTNYLIRNNGISNLRFITFESEKQQSICFAVRKDMPLLVSILDKALDSISDKEKSDITKRWIDLDVKIDYKPYIVIVVSALVFILLVFSFIFFLDFTSSKKN